MNSFSIPARIAALSWSVNCATWPDSFFNNVCNNVKKDAIPTFPLTFFYLLYNSHISYLIIISVYIIYILFYLFKKKKKVGKWE